MIRLSFIVPCYNVERYVQQCLDSIFACPLNEDEYEVVCIDDCSPDGSYEILKANEPDHPNMRIIRHTENKGLGGARNTGIREAKGQYLWFVDSDDFVSPEFIPEMIQLCVQNELDVLAFNYRDVDENGVRLKDTKVFEQSSVMDGIAFVKHQFGDNFVYHAGYVWRFFYKTLFLKEKLLYFPERVYWEDTVYMPKSLLSAQRVQSVSDVCYNYRRNASSVSGQYHKAYPADLICQMAFCAGRDLWEYADEVPDDQIAESFRVKAKSMINGFVLNLLRSTNDQRRKFYAIKRTYPVKVLKEQMNTLSRLFLLPVIGPLSLRMASIVYNMKHKSK